MTESAACQKPVTLDLAQRLSQAQMSALLSALLGSDALAPHAQSLLDAGIDTPHHLIAISRLCESDDLLRAVFDKVPGISKLAAALLKKGLRRLRAES